MYFNDIGCSQSDRRVKLSMLTMQNEALALILIYRCLVSEQVDTRYKL